MSLVALRDAIITSIDSEVASFRTIQSHGGRFDAVELKRWAVRSPAALVTCLGGPIERQGGLGNCTAKYAVFVVTHGSSQTARAAAALVLTESVAKLAIDNHWDYADAQAPTSVRIDNLYGGPVDKQGVALWAVTWTQDVDLAEYDADALDEFHLADTKWDLAFQDGIIDAEDLLRVWGHFMLSHGSLSLDALAATTIADGAVPQKIDGATSLGTATDFDMPANNRLRYTGEVDRTFLVTFSASMSEDEWLVRGLIPAFFFKKKDIAINLSTDEIIEAMIPVVVASDVNIAQSVTGSALVNLKQNEYIEAWVLIEEEIAQTFDSFTLSAVSVG